MYRKVVSLLKATLNEEKTGDLKMTAVAVTANNADAADQAEMD
jgi:ferritin-like metal-binding protein YciE